MKIAYKTWAAFPNSEEALKGIPSEAIAEVMEVQDDFSDPSWVVVKVDEFKALKQAGDVLVDEWRANWTPPIEECRANKFAAFQKDAMKWSRTHYTLDVQLYLLSLFVMAKEQGLVNRMAYIAKLFEWANSLISYSAEFYGQLMSMQDPREVLNAEWDFSRVSEDPMITPFGATQIND